jgi:hypothetical protein
VVRKEGVKFRVAVAKLKETLRNIKFATLCRSVCSVGTSLCVKDFYCDQNMIPFIHTYKPIGASPHCNYVVTRMLVLVRIE